MIFHAFEYYQACFQAITGRAKMCFERRDWLGQQADAVERLELYKSIIDPLVGRVRQLLGNRLYEKLIWASMKAVYSNLIEERPDCEIAETFFNSVTRRIFATVGVDPQIEFVSPDFELYGSDSEQAIYRIYPLNNSSLENTLTRILQDYAFEAPFVNMPRDVALVAERIGQPPQRIEMIHEVFFRGMGAYLIGRLVYDNRTQPIVISMLHSEEGLVIDGLLLDESSVSILFSFARSYFHVMIDRPYDLICFLRTMLPRKRIAELYISLGYNKHGKTELYRDFLNHLASSKARFTIAQGQRGMVMIVFSMPDYDVVFKIIKDRFAKPKNVTHKDVKAKYDWVFKRDRAGRLVDAQEFEHMQIDRAYFEEALLEELLEVAGNSVSLEGNFVVIKHAYLERKVTPLDVYLRDASAEAAAAAVIGYGEAIRDLANTNVFPGDMLLKNFGVTRHGRIVFYDYDELCPLTDCNFRKIPQAYYYEDELASEPWFAVAENDVFPEEFRHFITLSPELMKVFKDHHGELLAVDFWKETQQRIEKGEVIHIFPYKPEQRFGLVVQQT